MQDRSSSRSMLRIGTVALVVLLFTLAFYKIEKNGWQSRGAYTIHVVEYTMGTPRWVTYTSVASTGSPPPLLNLFEGSQYHPGLRIRPGWLALAWMLCLGVALCIDACVRWLRRRRPAEAPVHSFLLIGSLGIGVGAIVPTDPNWIGVVLGLGLLPASIAWVGWSSHRLAIVTLGSVIAILTVWWSRRMVLPLRYDHTELDLTNDLLAPALFLGMYLLVGCVATYCSRWWHRRRDAVGARV